MIRRVVVGLLSVAFLIAVAIAREPAGDDPPVRLKKKVRPDAAEKAREEPPQPAEPPKDAAKEKGDKGKEPKEGAEPPAPNQPEMDEGEVLNRVGKNMRTAEDRLANRELTDATRQVQEDILKDLDALINQEKNGGGGGNDQNQEQNQNQNDQQQNNDAKQGGQQKQGGKTKVGMGGKKRGLKGRQQARGQGQQQRGQGQAGRQPGGQGQQQANAGQGQKPQGQQGGGNQGGGGGQSQGEPTKLAEMYKDVWGTLPETMRAEMNAYSREQFMAKYNDLIKQYYSTVAEKSRKKNLKISDFRLKFKSEI